MVNVAASGVCVTLEREHINSGQCSFNVSTVLAYFYDMKVMEILLLEILIRGLSCHECPEV